MDGTVGIVRQHYPHPCHCFPSPFPPRFEERHQWAAPRSLPARLPGGSLLQRHPLASSKPSLCRSPSCFPLLAPQPLACPSNPTDQAIRGGIGALPLQVSTASLGAPQGRDPGSAAAAWRQGHRCAKRNRTQGQAVQERVLGKLKDQVRTK